LSGIQNSSDVPGKPYRTSLRLNSTAQISKEALILTIVVTHFVKTGWEFFHEYWQLGPQQKEA
jgi:hypothetical protein